MKKKNTKITRSLLLGYVSFVTAHSAQADVYNWNGGSANWDTSTPNWSGFGTTWPGVSTGNDDAVFGGTAGTVNLTTGIGVNDMTFNTTGYNISGANTLTLNGTANVITTGAGVSAAIGNNTATQLAGTTGFTKAGSGNLTLSPTVAATYTGTTLVKAGTLTLDYSNMGVNAANMIPVANNLTFEGNKTVDTKLVLKNAVGGGNTVQTLGTITNGRGASYILADPAAGTTMTLKLSNVAMGGTRGWNSTNGTVVIGVMSAAQESQFTFDLNNSSAIDNGGIVTASFLYTLDGGADPANLYFAGKSGNLVTRRTADVNTTGNFTGTANTQQLRITTTQIGQSWTNTGDISAQKGVLFVGAHDYTISGGTFGNSIPGTGTQNTRGMIVATWGTGALTIDSVLTNTNAASQLTKQGPGTLILTKANTYQNATNINGGVLSISQIGNGGNTPSGLGISSNAATNLNLDGGTLKYTGGTASTDRLFRLNADSGIDASGSGALNWTNAGTYTVNSVAGPKTLTLKGINIGDNILAGILSDQAAVTGATSLVKAESGKWILTNANTFSGGTSVTGGTLLANNTSGSALGTGDVTVSGGTFGGTGSITGKVTISGTGTLSAGASIESLSTGSVAFTGGSYLYELTTSTLDGDLTNITGTFDLSGSVALTLTDLGVSTAVAPGSKLSLFSYTGVWNNGTFSGYADDSTFTLGANSWTINYNDTTAGSNVLGGGPGPSYVTITATVIPEPTITLLSGIGLILLAGRRSKGNAKS